MASLSRKLLKTLICKTDDDEDDDDDGDDGDADDDDDEHGDPKTCTDAHYTLTPMQYI